MFLPETGKGRGKSYNFNPLAGADFCSILDWNSG